MNPKFGIADRWESGPRVETGPGCQSACLAHALQAKRARKAFSLVEVVLALGVTTFAMLAVLGLLPVGLATLRSSVEDNVRAQILRAIASQIVVSDFSKLETGGEPRFFDSEGQPTRNQGVDSYRVVTTTRAPVFPGSERDSGISESLVAVRVEMTQRGQTQIYTLNAANTGK